MTMAHKNLLLGHSPDPDDAFMFYALARGKVDTRGWVFEHVLEDIQTLNERALRGELHITAISIHAYPYVADKYALTACGSSMGDGYGPLVVTREPCRVEDLCGRTIAVPGEMTTAFLVLNLLLGPGRFAHKVVPFDLILDQVAEGSADAGLVIHEGQLTYQSHQVAAPGRAESGLHRVVDLGQWWKDQTGLPLPLGGNAIRRDLGAPAMAEIAGVLKSSIEFGLAHRAEGVDYALEFAHDMGREDQTAKVRLVDRFVGMYVNDFTLDYGESGRRAVAELLRRGLEAGLFGQSAELRSAIGAIDFIG
jgi:1,4-dihydroxy-6-naphthoate synthase